jgi:hypothetical protein
MARPRPCFYEVRESEKGFNGKHWKITAYIDGKRKQIWCASDKEAKTLAKEKNAELHAYGSELSDLTATQRADSQRAFELLRPYPGVTLTDLAKDYIRVAVARSASKPLDEFVDEYKNQFEARVASGEIGVVR